MADNNIAEIILRVTVDGQGNAQALANQLTQLDQATNKVADTTLSAAAAQKTYNTEIINLPAATSTQLEQSESRLQRLSQGWGDLQKQVDSFTTHTLQDFSSTSARALTGWIEGSKNAKQEFDGFVTSVIEGILQIVIQQIIAHTVLAALQGAFAGETAATGATTAAGLSSAYAVPATLASIASFGAADAAGVAGLTAALLAGAGITASFAAVGVAGHAGGGAIDGPGSETSDSIPAWLSRNEFVQPASAHNYYGTEVMEAMRTRSIPREAIRASMEHRTFACGGPVLPTRGFAEGGIAVRMATGGIAFNPNMNFETPPVIVGDEAMSAWLATSAGQKALDQHLASATPKLARSLHRQGGHQRND